jgi:glutathione synthase/RimK-type ligase-like ATP-grasp enzyme
VKIAFVTEERWPDLYVDDHEAVNALTKRGHLVDAVIWDDHAVDWTMYDAVVLRSPWDYYVKAEAFREWIDDLDRRGVRLINDPKTLRWNLDKIYLRDLADAGVPITPTVFAEQGAILCHILAERGWEEVVLKPRVSAAGHRTVRLTATDADDHQAELDDLVSHGGALIQPYLPTIETDGEWSLIFLDGAFSHAARKRAAKGEFRVQFQFGGTAETGKASDTLVDQATKVVNAVRTPWSYARVDGCVVDGQFLLMELEMLEPLLFLLQDARAADRLADAIERAVRP